MIFLFDKHSSFSQRHQIGNINIIANFVFPYICSFLSYLQHMMILKVKLNISGKKRIIFNGCKLHWFSLFLVVQLEWNWQYWHFVLRRVCEKPYNEAGWGSPDTWVAMCRERVNYFYISHNRLDLMPAFTMLWPSLLVVGYITLFWDIAKLLSAWCQLLYGIANSDIIVAAVLGVLTTTGWDICSYN